jgi:hypothetical protein
MGARKFRRLEKSTALLAGRRVGLMFASEATVTGRVRGDHGPNEVRWSRLTGWSCSCPGWGRCSHIGAVLAVTMRPSAAPLARSNW